MIVRSARPESNFTIISNDVINDQRLSFKARGLLVYLLSKPDAWRTTTAHLASVSPNGIDAVKTGMKELENVGYVRRVKSRFPDGTITTTTVVFDRPVDNHVDN
jgi:hypothetical protein